MNAISFITGWQLPFDPEDTSESIFRGLDGSALTVSMMRLNSQTNYADPGSAPTIELQYVGGEVSMVVIVPDHGEFEGIQAEFPGSTLFGIFGALGDASGDLRMSNLVRSSKQWVWRRSSGPEPTFPRWSTVVGRVSMMCSTRRL